MMNQAIIDEFNATMDDVETYAWLAATFMAVCTLVEHAYFTQAKPVILLAATTEHRTGAQRGFNQTRNTSNNSDGDADADHSGLIERNQPNHVGRTSWGEILDLLNAFETKLIKLEGANPNARSQV